MNKYIIYTDGGSRGNPGKAAVGVVIGEKKYGDYIGETTNNVAEYRALIFALKKAKMLLGKNAKISDLEIRADSELLIKQLNGEYKIKDENLKDLFIEVWNLKQDFNSVVFKHIPREKNKEADLIVNKILNSAD